ncbi:MAG TPA: PD-(D/E)XK nuclease family transposase [Arachidicoccus sp.]|nr:PD-(D/E)XK nuclease family transposase [Arachidicoccus sp.]
MSRHKEILIDFLNDILKGQKIIMDLRITNKEVLGKQIDNRSVLIDVACEGENGETFIVEVQRASQKFFNDRALYYCANIITTNAPKGKYNGVEWDYEQKEIYFVGILDFLLSNAPKQQYFHRVNLEYEGTHLKFSKKFQMSFLEVPKFSKEDNIISGIDQWMYIFKNLKNLKEVPRFLRIPKFKKLFAASNYL